MGKITSISVCTASVCGLAFSALQAVPDGTEIDNGSPMLLASSGEGGGGIISGG